MSTVVEKSGEAKDVYKRQTIDTLESVRAELAADDQLFMLIGWDAFCGLPTWHR